MWIRNLAVLILTSLGMTLSPHQGLARTPAVERALQPVLSDYELIRMEPSDIENQVKESGELRLTLKGVPFHFKLEPRDLRSPGYRAEVTGEDGVRRQLPPSPVTTFKGWVIGQEPIQGRFTITNDRFEGVVFTPEDWRYIEPLRNYLPSAEAAELVVYKHSDIKPGQEWRCGASKLKRGINQIEQAEVQAARDTTTTYKVEVATEADYEFVQYWGSAEAANREIRSVLNQVERVYEQELKLKLEIVYQHAWTRRNDPYTETDASDLLDQFTEHWNDNFFAEDYDLAHLWTDRDELQNEDGEEIGGIAWLGPVCRSRSHSYGISRRTSRRPGKFITTAHEIGHNFGSVHPDEEAPRLQAALEPSCKARALQRIV